MPKNNEKRCDVCNEVISIGAKRCPKCQRGISYGEKIKDWLLILSLGAAAFSIILMALSNFQSQKSYDENVRQFNIINQPLIDLEKIDCQVEAESLFLRINIVNIGPAIASDIYVNVSAIKSNLEKVTVKDTSIIPDLSPYGKPYIQTLIVVDPPDSLAICFDAEWSWIAAKDHFKRKFYRIIIRNAANGSYFPYSPDKAIIDSLWGN